MIMRSLPGLVLLFLGCLATAGEPLVIRSEWPAGDPAEAVLSFAATFRIGAQAPLRIELATAEGSNHVIRVKGGSQRGCHSSKVYKDTVFDNSVLQFQGAVNLDYYARPRVVRYTDDQIKERISAWEKLPAATDKDVRLELRPGKQDLAVWLDGRYAGRIAGAGNMKSVTFTGGPDAVIEDRQFFKTEENDRFLPLNYGLVAQSDAMKTSTVSLVAGVQRVAGIPMIVADGPRSGDIARIRQMRGSWALECDEYLSRTSFDGMPESQLISVPQHDYRRAWVLFAVDPDPSKDPILTVRLTRFAGQSRVGRGGAIADTYLTLPRAGSPLGGNVKQVGTVAHTFGREVEIPLYLAEVEIPLGEILDLLAQEGQDPATDLKIGPFLDFEILGRRGVTGAQWDGQRKPTGAPSAANIFAVTLEKAPAELRLTQTLPGNVFHNDDIARTDLAVSARQAGRYTVGWTIRDVAGRVVRKDKETFSLAAGKSARRSINLAMPEIGYYSLSLELSDDSGTRILSHEAAFALLGQDTRQAGYESPYSIWWYGGAGLTEKDIQIAGPLHLKAGLRKTTYHDYTEQEMAPWKMTRASFGWLFRGDVMSKDGVLSEEAKARAAKTIDEGLVSHPHCDNVLIFHESHANTMPVELAGIEPTFTPEEEGKLRDKARLGNLSAEFFRQRYPQLKVIFGNSSGTARITADLLRYGFNPGNIDYVGIESPSQTFIPESISEHNILAAWMVRAIGRQQGRELPLTGCYEFTYRLNRVLGKPKQAEYYVRDILLSHAYGFAHIGPGTLSDPGGSYFNSGYGGNGLLERFPLLYPKPSYVAVATATKVLDKVRLRRVVPSGSLTVYVLEFDRLRQPGDIAYALWTPRGEAVVNFEFPKETEVRVIDLYGREKTLRTRKGSVSVTTSTAATYLVCAAPAGQVTLGERRFPLDVPPPGFQPAARMDRLEDWQQVADETLAGDFAQRGNFALRQVDDPERGPCLEVELAPAPGLKELVAEYTTLQLKTPVEVPGEPHTIGVWVKGNSNWGRILFEITDKENRVWLSSGSWRDWGGDLSVNFDGWCFLRFHIDESRSPVKNVSPGRQWRCLSAASGPWPPAYPIKITGLHVNMHHQAIDPVEMRDVVPVLRFQNLGAY